MSITLGGQSCLDPQQLWEECRRQAPPLSTEPWFGLANQMTCPLGPDAGTGHLIMSRRNFAQLDANAKQDLVFSYGTGTRTFKNLLITSDVCVTPGLRGDLAAATYLTVADRRQELAKIPIDRGYNLWHPDGSDYFHATLRGLYPWTWQQMADDIVGVLGIPTMTLPYAPDTLPDNWDFYGDTAWHALNAVLAKLDCAVRWDPEADTFSIVELGAEDAQADASLVIADSFRDWDWEPVGLTRARVPAKVWVRFTRFPAPSDGTSSYFFVERTAPGTITTATSTGSKIILPDDLPALCDGGNNVTNSSDCGVRATQRRDKYYQALAAWAVTPLSRRYVGVLSGTALLPGPRISSYAVHDLGGGYRTEVARLRVPAAEFHFFEPVEGSTSTGGGDTFAIVDDEGATVSTGGRHRIYSGTLPDPQWSPITMDWPTTGSKIWLISRTRQALYPTLVVSCHQVGTWDPHDDDAGKASDRRPMYGTIAVSKWDIVKVTSKSPLLIGGDTATKYYPAQPEFWDNVAHSRQVLTRDVFVIDWFNHDQIFDLNDRFFAEHIGWIDPNSSGTPKPLYRTIGSFISSDFLRCFENLTLARDGRFVIEGGRILFRQTISGTCTEKTDLDVPCTLG